MRLIITCAVMIMTGLSQAADPKPVWQAYWLVGGPSEKNGYQILLITQVGLEDLAKAAPQGKSPNSILESSAFWIETHGKDSIWNSDLQPIKVPPPMVDYRAKDRLVRVKDVEYRIEPMPIATAIRLLREPYGTSAIHRRYPPLSGMDRTAKALVALLEAETKDGNLPTKLHVGGSFGGARNVITSQIAEPHPRAGTKHGPEVILGTGLRLREWAIYDMGFLTWRTSYIEDGFELALEQFTREPIPNGHGANGTRRVQQKGRPGQPASILAEGYLLDGKPWQGSFVFVEIVPGNTSFEYPVRLVCREYVEGKVTATKTDITLGFGDQEKDQKWLKALPEVLRDR